MNDTTVYKAYLNTAKSLAREASRVLLHNFDRLDRIKVQDKGAGELVSDLDMQLDDFIVTKLHDAYPDHAVLSEEQGLRGDPNAEFCWVIDPLDGTTNYLSSIPFYCISIALLHRNTPVVGLIYQPATDELFAALYGGSARLNDYSIRRTQTPNNTNILALSPGVRWHTGSLQLPAFLSQQNTPSLRLRLIGSAALAAAYQACGRFRVFYGENLKIWDVAAASLLAQQAGCLVKTRPSSSIAHGIAKIIVVRREDAALLDHIV